MPDPEVIQLMRQFKAQLLERETNQVQQLVSAWRILETTLEAQIFALAQDAADLGASGGVPSQNAIFRLGRFEALIAQIDSELANFTDEAENLITDGQLNIGLLGIEQAGASISSAAGIQVSFAVLPVEAIENMVAMAGDGSPLRTLLEASWPDAVEGLTNALIEGTALGRNPRVVARQMADGMAHSLNRMLNIARTEQLRVYREATRQQYINSGVVEGFRRLATHDSRVCPACLMSEGERYELDEQLREHPQGRCLLPGQTVLTRRGEVNIEDVRVGDWVLTHKNRYRLVLATSHKMYSGEVVKLSFEGNMLKATPEHPVLTQRGWVEASELKASDTLATLYSTEVRPSNRSTVQPKSDNVLSFLFPVSTLRPALCHRGSNSTANFIDGNAKSTLKISTANSHTGDSPALFNAANSSASLGLCTVFHRFWRVKARRCFAWGEFLFLCQLFRKSGLLFIWRFAASEGLIGSMLNWCINFIRLLVLIFASLQSSLYVAFSSTYRRLSQISKGSPSWLANCCSHFSWLIRPLSLRVFRSPNVLARWTTALRVRLGSNAAMAYESIPSKFLRMMSSSSLLQRMPAINEPLKIVDESYDGWVYDLQVDGDQSFVANNIIVHNCTLVPIITGVENPTWQLGPDWFREQPANTQQSILGPGRFAAWQDGAFELDQLVSVRENETWGASVQPTPLKELVP